MRNNEINKSNDNTVKSAKKQWLWFIGSMMLGLLFTLFIATFTKYFVAWINLVN